MPPKKSSGGKKNNYKTKSKIKCGPKGLPKNACVRGDKNCCQAICTQGTRCHNKGTITVPIGQLSSLGATVVKKVCSFNKVDLVDVPKNECCKICKVHFNLLVKNGGINIFSMKAKTVCETAIKNVTPYILETIGTTMGFPGVGTMIGNAGVTVYERGKNIHTGYKYAKTIGGAIANKFGYFNQKDDEEIEDDDEDYDTSSSSSYEEDDYNILHI